MKAKGTFRLYQREHGTHNSTIFDLMDGNHETKQTKGLAYLFYNEPQILYAFLKMDLVKRSITDSLEGTTVKYSDIINPDYFRVDAEMTSISKENPVRRDIVISFYKNSSKIFVLVVEAKSIKLGNVSGIEEQLEMYFDKEHFPDDLEIPKCGITLTKYKTILNSSLNFVSITWNEVISILKKYIEKESNENNGDIVAEYFKFITGVEKDMNFYEKEVLSVPAGNTHDIIEKYEIHACPNTSTYNYKKPIYIAFRKSGGGVMSKLYKVDDIILINPHNESELESYFEQETSNSKRIKEYVKDRKSDFGFNNDSEYQFYVLSQSDQIKLEHNPKPPTNSPGGRYYKLSELLSGKEIVAVEGK